MTPQLKKRGIDYPPWNEKNIKMPLVMTEEQVKKWFTEEELKDYPKPDAYHGPLP